MKEASMDILAQEESRLLQLGMRWLQLENLLKDNRCTHGYAPFSEDNDRNSSFVHFL